MDMLTGMMTMTSLDLVALGAVVLIGLPHGALDGAIAMHLGYANRILNFLKFIGLYVLMAGLVVGAWILMPALCLLGFLVISMLHFGAGDARHGTGWMRGAEIVAHGGLVVAGISQMHRPEVDIVFGYLVGGDTTFVWQGLDVMTAFVALALVVCIVQALWFRKWRGTAAELVLLAVLFAMVPPLVGFAFYFCCVHSARHIAGVFGSLRRHMSVASLGVQALVFTLASWFAGFAAGWWLVDVTNPEPTVMRVIFIGLAALTVPHMILVDGFYRRSTKSLKRQFISR